MRRRTSKVKYSILAVLTIITAIIIAYLFLLKKIPLKVDVDDLSPIGLDNQYSVEIVKTDNLKTNKIYLIDRQTGKKKVYAYVDDLNINYSDTPYNTSMEFDRKYGRYERIYSIQYAHGYIFTKTIIVPKSGDSTESFRSEIRKYGKNGDYAVLNSGDFVLLSFENSEIIAVSEYAQGDGDIIYFLNVKGEVIKSFTYADLAIKYNQSDFDKKNNSWPNFQFIGQNSSSIWYETTWGMGQTTGYTQVDAEDLSVAKYNLTEVLGRSTHNDLNININLKKIAYSNIPDHFGLSNADLYKYLGKTTLYIYDLENKTNIPIANSKAIEFSPKWIDNNTLQYYDANRSETITRNF